MLITRLQLQNWKNFAQVDVKLSPRTFIVGNNGAGKSNLMDALRFLRDIANPKGGGLQTALDKRGGIKRTRYLSARQDPTVRVGVEVTDEKSSSSKNTWQYDIVIKQEPHGKRRVLVKSEKVWCNGKEILSRPDKQDQEDSDRMTQTALEQIGENKDFRELAEFFQSFKYLHTVPQLIRHSSEIQGKILADDPFGQDLMNSIAAVPTRMRESRLKRISEIFEKIKPAFKDKGIKFELGRDDHDIRHLKFKHPSWHSNDSWQTEEILSDGELRLIGLLWTVLAPHTVILLEEPELSFNEGIIGQLPNFFSEAMESKKKGKGSQQIIMSTHSYALLSDQDIYVGEVLYLKSEREATTVTRADDLNTIVSDMRAGIPASQAILRFAQSDYIGLSK